METLLIIACVCLLVLSVSLYLSLSAKWNAEVLLRESAEEKTSLISEELQQERDLLAQANEEKIALRESLANFQAKLEAAQQRFDQHVSDRESMMRQFQRLSDVVLQERAQQFDTAQQSSLSKLLEPLQQRIKSFEHKVDQSQTLSTERHAALREQVKQLTEINVMMGEEAQRLTNALKADVKEQGRWGELILERILEQSGLERDREYLVQESKTNEEGKRYQTDILILLPDHKRLVIDSKVSLKDYEAYVNAEDDHQRRISLKAHALSTKKHIDILAQKNYHELYHGQSPDFVLMFVPMDNAFAAASKFDPNLYAYAYERQVIIVTPASLLAVMKTVDTLWNYHKQSTNAQQIAIEAGKMYDKFVGFVTDLDKLGKQLNTVQSTYNDSMNKLQSGTGNLVKRAQQLKKLGAKAQKELGVME